MPEQFEPHPRVLARFAEAFRNNISMKKTHLFAASRTNWYSMSRYLNWLKNHDYLELTRNGEDEIYTSTETGKQMFNKLLEFLEYVKQSK